jgi:excisionase family DNA binding protein
MGERMEPPSERRLLAPNEVAALCGLSRKAVYRAIERGELPASKLCSRLRIRPEDLDLWIEANRLEKEAAVSRPFRHVPAPNGLRARLASSKVMR